MTDFIYISPFMCPFLDKEIWRALNYTSSFMCLFLDLNDIISLGLYEVIYVFNSWLRWILIFVIKVMAGAQSDVLLHNTNIPITVGTR